MRALTWQGIGDVRVQEVPDPRIQDPSDAIVRVTSTAICGSDLHLYGADERFLYLSDILPTAWYPTGSGHSPRVADQTPSWTR